MAPQDGGPQRRGYVCNERNTLRMLYTHLERAHLESVLPAALLLAADRVLRHTGLGHLDGDGGLPPRSSDRVMRFVRAIGRVPHHYRWALIARGVRRRLSLIENLRRLGISGLLSTATSAVGDALREAQLATPHRIDYLVERGSQAVELKKCDHCVPAAASAALLGVQEFLASLPELERRRKWLQARRRRSDLEILKPFNSEWLFSSNAARDELRDVLIETFGLADIAGATVTQRHRARHRHTRRGAGMQGYPSGRTHRPACEELDHVKDDIDSLLDAADASLATVEHEYNAVRHALGTLAGSRLRRALAGAVEITRGTLRAVRRLGSAGTLREHSQRRSLADDATTYEHWLAANAPTATELRAMQETIPTMAIRPVISIVTPVYNTNPELLRACIDSVRRQIYPNWQLCLCDDGSTSEATLQVLRDAAADPRVCVTYLTSNEGIAGASNTALETARGEFVAMCDHDDELTPDALYQMVRHLNAHPDADVFYSDEDKLDRDGGRCDPYFKPDWSPEHFLTCMYICHLLIVRRSVMLETGGFRSDYDGAQDFDLALRVIQRTSRVHHIARVLYHWRKVEGSMAGSVTAKPWAFDAARRAITDHAIQTDMDAEVELLRSSAQYRIRYRLRGQPIVSIVMTGAEVRRPITSADTAATLRCLAHLEDSDYAEFEVIVVEDGSMVGRDRAALRTKHSRLVTCPQTAGADLATRVNFGVSQSVGVHVVVCCNLVEPRDKGWLQRMLEVLAASGYRRRRREALLPRWPASPCWRGAWARGYCRTAVPWLSRLVSGLHGERYRGAKLFGRQRLMHDDAARGI